MRLRTARPATCPSQLTLKPSSEPRCFQGCLMWCRRNTGTYRHPDLWHGQVYDIVSPVVSPAPFRAFENWNKVAGAVELIAAGNIVPPVPLLQEPAPIYYRNPCCAIVLRTASPSSLTQGSRTMPACSHTSWSTTSWSSNNNAARATQFTTTRFHVQQSDKRNKNAGETSSEADRSPQSLQTLTALATTRALLQPACYLNVRLTLSTRTLSCTK